MKPPNLAYSDSRNSEEIMKKTGLTKRWQLRQISNFEYLMQLNTIAGDLSRDFLLIRKEGHIMTLRSIQCFPGVIGYIIRCNLQSDC